VTPLRTVVAYLLASIVVASLAFGQAPAAQPAASSASKVGTAVGTALSTALTTAFPVIGTVLNAIWPAGKENNNQKKSNATAATAPLKQQQNQGLQDLTKISAELTAISTFLSACVTAEGNVASLRGYVRGKTTLSDDDKLQVSRYWNPAKDNIGSLKNSAQAINNLGNPSIQQTFRDVANANNGLVDNINTELASKAPSALSDLTEDLSTLDSKLAALNALSGEIIVDISVAINSAKNTAAGAGGSTSLTDAQKASRAAFDSVLSKAYPKIQR
jgi:hypothetical protein